MTIDVGSIEFLERLNGDTSLQSELKTALVGAADKTGAVVAFAATKGFHVDRDGFDAARVAIAGAIKDSRALDDSELEAVAGGFNPQPDPPGRIANLVRVISFDSGLLTSW